MTANLEYAPQWPMRLTPQWETPIIVARDGTEQRSANRPLPRWLVEYTLLLEDADKVRQMCWLLHRNLGETWRVPMWWESFRVTVEAASGQDVIEGDFSLADLVAGDRVYILNRQTGTGEIGTVATPDTTNIQLSGNLAETYPAGSRVYLMLNALLREGQGMSRYLGVGATLDVAVDVSACRDLGGSGQGISLTEYRGIPVLDRRAFGEMFRESHHNGDRRIDFGGVFENVQAWDAPQMRFDRRYELAGRAALQWAKLFLSTVIGKRDPFWCPTWAADFVITAGGGSGETTITVASDPAGLIDEWFADAAEPHVQLQDSAGAVLYRRVQSIAGIGNTRTLTLDDPVDAGFTTAVASLLQLCRLDEDETPIEMPSPGRYLVDLAIRTLDETSVWLDAPLSGSATSMAGLDVDGGHTLFPIAGDDTAQAGLVVTGGTTIDGQSELLLLSW